MSDMTEKERIMQTLAKEIEENTKNKKLNYEIPSGISELDEVLQGLKNGDINIIASRPGIGKSTFALYMYSNMISQGICALYISFEKNEKELLKNLISVQTHIDTRCMENGYLRASDLSSLFETMGSLFNNNTFYLKSFFNTNIITLKDYIKRKINEANIKIVFIDYLTMIIPAPTYTNRWEQVSEISRSLKSMAMEFNIPFIVLCPINRNAVENNPVISDLSESGSIESDADRIILLYKDINDKKLRFIENDNTSYVTLCVAKNRRGPLGKFKLVFDYSRKIFSSFKMDNGD
jgi:replicative DNA helicase